MMLRALGLWDAQFPPGTESATASAPAGVTFIGLPRPLTPAEAAQRRREFAGGVPAGATACPSERGGGTLLSSVESCVAGVTD
jgi:hypothetical protein